MPKLGVDYSNTIIYKIECKDKRITEFYIGHTTNFIKRKYQHKTSCNTSTNLKLQIYKTIIDNEYQKILDSAYSVLEKELEEVEDENYIKLIERKIKIIDDRVQLFLED